MDSAFSFSDAAVSLAVGAFLCVFYDIVRVLLPAKRKFFEAITDIIFFVFAGLVFSVLQFNLTSGKMRAYPFVFAALGFAAWRKTFGALFRKTVYRVKKFISRKFLKTKIKTACFLKYYSSRIYTRRYCRLTLKKAKRGNLLSPRKDKNYESIRKKAQ